MANADDIMELDPEAISDDATYEVVRTALTAEDNLTRSRATSVCLDLAEDIDRVMPVVPSLIERLDDDNIVVLLNTTTALALVAEQRPEALNAAVGPLIERLGDDHSRIRLFAAQALQSISESFPEWFVPHVDALVSRLEGATRTAESLDTDETIGRHVEQIRTEENGRRAAARSITGELLVTVADADPNALEPHTDTLCAFLSRDDTTVVLTAAKTIGTLAEHAPDLVSGCVDPVSACLSHDSEQVRTLAVVALGFIIDTDAVAPLRTVADDEDNSETLRGLAAETADWIVSETGSDASAPSE